MTVLQRIELHKQGYSKEEINALAEDERVAAAQPAPEPEPVQPAPTPEPEPAPTPAPAPAPQPDTAVQLLVAINNLTNALTAQNFISKEQPVAKPETATDIFNNILKG